MTQHSNDGFTSEQERESLARTKAEKKAKKRREDPLHDYRHTGDTGEDAWVRKHSGWNK